MENWKIIPEFPNYQVSTASRIKSTFNGVDTILTPFIVLGYEYINLYNEDGQKTCRFHRLLAQAFIPNPLNKPYVNHINSEKADNRLENLEWVTASENTRHSFASGTQSRESYRKPILQLDLQGNLVKEWAYATEPHLFGFSKSGVSKVLKGHKKSYKGFLWVYKK